MARIERSARFDRLIEYLDDEGALTQEVQRPYEQIEVAIDVPARTLARFIKRAEQLGLVRVRRTTSGGRFGAPRVHNFYKLTMSYRSWSAKGTEISNRYVERKQAVRAKQSLASLVAPTPPKAKKVLKPEEVLPVGVLARRHLDDDDLLDGW